MNYNNILKLIVIVFMLCVNQAFSQWNDISDSMYTVNGENITVIEDFSLGDIANSHYEFGNRVIRFNPIIFNSSIYNIRLFFVLHELGHHHLQHFNSFNQVLVFPIFAEFSADCFSIEFMLKENFISVSDARILVQLIPFGISPVHPTPFQRRSNLLMCIDNFETNND